MLISHLRVNCTSDIKSLPFREAFSDRSVCLSLHASIGDCQRLVQDGKPLCQLFFA